MGDDLRNAGRDAGCIVRSPLEASRTDLATVALLGAAAAGITLFADQPIHEWVHTDPPVLKLLAPVRESSPLSVMGRSYLFLLPLSATLYGAGHVFDSSALREAGTGCITSNVTTTVTRSAVTLLMGRLRPGAHAGPFQFELFASGPWPFPGGHASNLNELRRLLQSALDLGVAGPAVYALASGIGLARIVDGAHGTSDTFVGMAYGYAVGRGVARRLLERRADAAERSLHPGLNLGLRITF